MLLTTIIDGLEWCGLLVIFFDQLFGLSFWRHPFTAEDPLLSKWFNAEFLQICRRNKLTCISAGLRVQVWVKFRQIFIFWWTVPLRTAEDQTDSSRILLTETCPAVVLHCRCAMSDKNVYVRHWQGLIFDRGKISITSDNFTLHNHLVCLRVRRPHTWRSVCLASNSPQKLWYCSVSTF